MVVDSLMFGRDEGDEGGVANGKQRSKNLLCMRV